MTRSVDDLAAMRDRLYAALKHEKSCTCGECSGGLNTVDNLVSLVGTLTQERDEAHSHEDDLMRERDNYESMWRMQRDRAVAAEAALVEMRRALDEERQLRGNLRGDLRDMRRALEGVVRRLDHEDITHVRDEARRALAGAGPAPEETA